MPGRYRPCGFFLLRAPALPARTFQDLMADHDPDATRCSLRQLGALPEVKQALYVASPDLVDALDRPDVDTPKKRNARLYSRLNRYLTRMSTRPTPFGAFSGVAIGELGDTTDLSLGSRSLAQSRVRADMSWLLALIAQVEADPAMRPHLRLVRNPSVYFSVGRAFLPFADVYGRNDNRSISVRATPPVTAVMRIADRPILQANLAAEVMAGFPDASADQVADLVAELWKLNFLMTDLRPPVNSETPEAHVLDRLVEAGVAENLTEELSGLIGDMSVAGGGDLAALTALSARQAALVPTHNGPTYQLDSVLDVSTRRLNREIGEAIADAIDCLMRLSAALPGHHAHLAQYRSAFQERFGHNALVPVLEVLSPEHGLDAPPTYTNPPRTYALDVEHDAADLSDVNRVLTELAVEAWRSGAGEVELSDEWLERLAPAAAESTLPPYPVLDAFAQIHFDDPRRADSWRVVFRQEALAYGGRTFGRFFHVLGEPAVAQLRSLADLEESRTADTVFAEVSYLPTLGRATNVALRPQVRGYEIPINTIPSVPSAKIITLDDLHLGAADDRLFLWSKRLGKQVSVSQATMLSPQLAPNIARFLLEVSADGYATPSGFQWGAVESMPFLPRVTRAKVVLRPAQWNLDKGMLTRLDPDTDVAVALWRQKWCVPRHVYLIEGDNRLMIDLDHPIGVQELTGEVRRRSVVLEEVLPALDDWWLADAQGKRYAHEVVVPVATHTGVAVRPQPPKVSAEFTQRHRLHLPGSRWSYVRLYSALAAQDGILVGPLHELVEELRSRELIDRWFYIRYADPVPHLRIRFRAADDATSPALLRCLLDWSNARVEEGVAAEFVVDGYRPEVDRYGGDRTFDAVERLFADNSDSTIALLTELRSGRGLNTEDAAVAAVDMLYSQLGLGPAERLALAPDGADSPTVRKRFRENREYITQLLAPWRGGGDDRVKQDRAVLQNILSRQAEAAKAVGVAVDNAERAGALVGHPATVFGSLAHMQFNRLLPIDLHREREGYAIWRHVLRAVRGRPAARTDRSST